MKRILLYIIVAAITLSSCKKVGSIPGVTEPTESVQVMFDKSVGQLIVNGKVYSVGNTEGMGVVYVEAKEIKKASFFRFGGERTEITIQKRGVIIKLGNIKNYQQSWEF